MATKTFAEWLAEQPESVQMWHRSDVAAKANPNHPHHGGHEERIEERRQQYRDECGGDTDE